MEQYGTRSTRPTSNCCAPTIRSLSTGHARQTHPRRSATTAVEACVKRNSRVADYFARALIEDIATIGFVVTAAIMIVVIWWRLR